MCEWKKDRILLLKQYETVFAYKETMLRIGARHTSRNSLTKHNYQIKHIPVTITKQTFKV